MSTKQDPPALEAAEAAEQGMVPVVGEKKDASADEESFDEKTVIEKQATVEEEVVHEDEENDEEAVKVDIDADTVVSSIAGDVSQHGDRPTQANVKANVDLVATPNHALTNPYDDSSMVSSIGINSARQTNPISQQSQSFKITRFAERDVEMEDKDTIIEENESAISAIADEKWNESKNEFGFHGICSCPHGPFGVAAILLSLTALALTGFATERCDFVSVGSDELTKIWNMSDHNVGLIKFQAETGQCTYWFEDSDNADKVYDLTWDITRILILISTVLGLCFVGLLCTLSCIAHNILLCRRLAFGSLVFPLLSGVSFVILGSDVCQNGTCSIGVGGLVMVLGVVSWLIAACMLCMVPDAKRMPSKRWNSSQELRHRVYLGLAILFLMALIIGIDTSVISFRKSSQVDATTNETTEAVTHPQTMDWLQTGETLLGPYPDTPDYVSLSGDATTLALIGKESFLVMEYDIVKGDWHPQGNMIPADTDRRGWNRGDHITQIQSSAVSLSDDGKTVAIGSSNWAITGGSEDSYHFGRVQIWEYNTTSTIWEIKGLPINGKSKDDLFASKIVLSSDGSRLAVLANGEENTKQPYARIYEYSGAPDREGAWIKIGDDVVLDSAWVPSGFSFSGDGSTLALGSKRIGRLGLVTIWKYDGEKWNRKGSNLASGLSVQIDKFGESIALNEDGTVVIVGDPGAAVSYARVLGLKDGKWERLGQDLPCDTGGRCAHDVAISKHGSIVALTEYGSQSIARVYSMSSVEDQWQQVGGDINGPQPGAPSQSTTIDLAKDGQRVAFGVTYNDTRTQLWRYIGDPITDTSLVMEGHYTLADVSATSAPDTETDVLPEELTTPELDVSFITNLTSQNASNDAIGFPYLSSFNNTSQPVIEPQPWIKGKQHKDIFYFLFSTVPRIERYDIGESIFLSTLLLPADHGPAKTFGINDQDHLYVGYGKEAYKYDLNATMESPLSIEATTDIIDFHFDGNIVFINAGQYFISFNGENNTVIQKFFSYNELPFGSVISQSHKRILGRTPDEVAGASNNIIRHSDIWFKDYDERGKFIDEKSADSDWEVNFESAARTWMFPDQTRIVDDKGLVFSVTSSEHVYTIETDENSTIIDIAWVDEEAMIILQEAGTITYISQELVAMGSMHLGYTPTSIAVNVGDILTFKHKSNSTQDIEMNSIYLSLLSPSHGRGIDPTNVPYSPEFTFVDKNQQLYLLSRGHSSIFVMSLGNRTYVESIFLEEIPKFVAYSAENHEIYTFRFDGVLSKIDLGAQNKSEVNIATLTSEPLGLSTAGKFIFVVDASGSVATHYTFLNDGTIVSAVDWNHIDKEYVWSGANRGMYFFRQADPTDLMKEHIYENGTIGIRVDSFMNTNVGFIHPIRISPDGQYAILGSGMIHNAKTLQRLNVSLSNAVLDIAFTNNDVRTIRNTEDGMVQLQQWLGPSFSPGKVVEVSGEAHSLLSFGSNETVAVITQTGVPSAIILDGNFSIV